LALHPDKKRTLKSQKLFPRAFFVQCEACAFHESTQIKITLGGSGFAVCVFDPCAASEVAKLRQLTS